MICCLRSPHCSLRRAGAEEPTILQPVDAEIERTSNQANARLGTSPSDRLARHLHASCLFLMIATYHNHTRWSDGKTAAADLLEEAARLGVDELGISDHFILHPEGKEYPWAIPHGQLDAYVQDLQSIQAIAREQTSVTLRIGLEVDWFPGFRDELAQALANKPFDYLIGSVHEVDGFITDSSPEPWKRLTEEDRNEVHRRYWRHMHSLAESGLFDIAAHLDLPKKFGFYPTADISAERNAALDAIAEANLVVELNTAGWHKVCNDGYPSLEILRACRERDIAVTLSADAHQPEHLLRDFPRGTERLREAGYTHLMRFRERERIAEPLEKAADGLDS